MSAQQTSIPTKSSRGVKFVFNERNALFLLIFQQRQYSKNHSHARSLGIINILHHLFGYRFIILYSSGYVIETQVNRCVVNLQTNPLVHNIHVRYHSYIYIILYTENITIITNTILYIYSCV